ncbi:cytochrome c oxidase assembly protein [Aquibacillus rhizosphaerae]|uniref:Cytochrome c oxidase assembly protein n=1 Tax=Aquibacillus rhizosphaerae TaxID=3051431 RepID=A0ABT7L4V3_9BACI|nr:cytochrome c oxidase assembly protein [Aquibacillus sp. LR5S19]MDL4840879.1 cytochrome c oxidase assembly protein [Aquibacillus sp. LR5S19]
MNGTHHTNLNLDGIGLLPQLVLILPFAIGLLIYVLTVIISNRKYKKWSFFRMGYWLTGSICAISSITGPLAELSHSSFEAHMFSHLLLGMLAPLLMVLAAPLTLLMRALNVNIARRLSRLLRSRLVSFLTNPIIAAILNIGGLWILYTSNLYSMMHHNISLYIFIHLHVFIAGFLFTSSMIYIDPTPHRKSYIYRSSVLIITLAAHGILSKFIYANPPNGVSISQAEMGAKIMYYGGDVIDIVIIFILCLKWYQSTKPRLYSPLRTAYAEYPQ